MYALLWPPRLPWSVDRAVGAGDELQASDDQVWSCRPNPKHSRSRADSLWRPGLVSGTHTACRGLGCLSVILLLSWWSEYFLTDAFPWSTEQCQRGWWIMKVKQHHSSFPFNATILRMVAVQCGWSFLSGLQSSPRLIVFVESWLMSTWWGRGGIKTRAFI